MNSTAHDTAVFGTLYSWAVPCNRQGMYATGEGGLAVIEQEQGDSVASPIARCLSISAPALALLAAHVGGSAAIVVGGLFIVGLMILGFFTPPRRRHPEGEMA